MTCIAEVIIFRLLLVVTAAMIGVWLFPTSIYPKIAIVVSIIYGVYHMFLYKGKPFTIHNLP